MGTSYSYFENLIFTQCLNFFLLLFIQKKISRVSDRLQLKGPVFVCLTGYFALTFQSAARSCTMSTSVAWLLPALFIFADTRVTVFTFQSAARSCTMSTSVAWLLPALFIFAD